MNKYVCIVCGYIYDEHCTENETLFHDLPEGYVCPECGEEKDVFQQIDN